MVDLIISHCFYFSADFASSGDIISKNYYLWSENENPSVFNVSIPEQCTSNNPCEEGEGDCDSDEQCIGDLRCGQGNGLDDNCNSESFPAYYDCCYEPEG